MQIVATLLLLLNSVEALKYFKTFSYNFLSIPK